MGNRFSLATLLLLVAIAAVGVGSLRTAAMELLTLDDFSAALAAKGPVLAGVSVVGGLVGLVFGAILGAWNQRRLGLGIASALGGCFLGVSAAAQCMLRTQWPVLFVAPILLIGGTVLVALNELRQRGVSRPPRV